MGYKGITPFLLTLYIICIHANVHAPKQLINDGNPTLAMSKEKLADLVSQNRKLVYSEPMLSVLNSTNVQSVPWACRSDFRTLALDYILPGVRPNPYAVRSKCTLCIHSFHCLPRHPSFFHNSRLIRPIEQNEFWQKWGLSPKQPDHFPNYFNHYTTESESTVLTVSFKLHLHHAPSVLSNSSNLCNWMKMS